MGETTEVIAWIKNGDIRATPGQLWDKLIEAATALEHAAAREAKMREALVKFVDHFGPLEDNSMVHSEARKCFKLARKALGPKEHGALIRAALSGEPK